MRIEPFWLVVKHASHSHVASHLSYTLHCLLTNFMIILCTHSIHSIRGADYSWYDVHYI